MVSPRDLWGAGRPAATVTGFGDCRRALVDPGVTSDPHLAGQARHAAGNLLLMSGPRHRCLRQLLAPLLAPTALGPTGARLHARAARLRDQLLADDSAELIGDLVEPLVVEGTFHALGFHRRDDRRVLEPVVRSMLGMLDPPGEPGEPGEPPGGGLPPPAWSILGRVVAFERRARRRRPAGLHAALLAARDGGQLSDGEVALTIPVVLHGGYENPVNFLGLLAARAHADPVRFGALARTRPGTLLDETLRLAGTVRGVVRWAVVDLPYLGAARGDMLWIDLEAANRDPAAGDRSPHLAFGWGPHRCPGVHLARAMGHAVIEVLSQLPREALAGARVVDRVGPATRGVAAMALGRAA